MDIKLGLKLREFRKAKGLSVRGLARLSRRSHSDISNVENEKWDKVNPSMKWWKDVCKALDMTYEEFVFKSVVESFETVETQIVRKWIKDSINNYYKLEITFQKLASKPKSEEK